MTGRGIDQILPHPGKPEIHESYMKDARAFPFDDLTKNDVEMFMAAFIAGAA